VLRTGRPFHEDRLLESGEIPSPDEIDGKFALLSLKTDELELLTDWLGAGAVYYTLEEGSLYFGSHLGLVLRALPRVPDLSDLGVAALLYTRTQVFDETHFSGVFRLAAGQCLHARLEPDQAVVHHIEQVSEIEDLFDIDAPRMSVETFTALLESGIARERYGPNSVLMLSGGRDSYAIALSQSQTPGRAITYGESYSIDLLRGRRRAKRLGLEFDPVPYHSWTLETYQDVIIGLHGGCAGLHTAHNIVGFDWASQRASLAAVGYLGDLYREKYLKRVDGRIDEASVLKWLAINHANPVLRELYPKEGDTVVEYLTDTFYDLVRQHGPHRALTILKLRWQETRWLSLTFDLFDWFLPISCPFVQRKMVASWMQSDLEDAKSRNVFDPFIKRALAERGDSQNYRGSILERICVRGLATMLPLLNKGKHATKLCDWPAVFGRSRFPSEDSISMDHRLSEVTKRSWQRVQSGEDKTLLPVALLSAPIAAAYVQQLRCNEISSEAIR
jgi:hypothetical protein